MARGISIALSALAITFIAPQSHAQTVFAAGAASVAQGDGYCAVSTQFVAGDRKVGFELRDYGGGSNPSIFLTGALTEQKPGSDIDVRFGPDGGYQQVEVDQFAPGVLVLPSILLRATDGRYAAAKKAQADWQYGRGKARAALPADRPANTLSLRGGAIEETYPLGWFDGLAAQRQSCLDQLEASRGVDPRVISVRASPAVSPGDWIRPDDAPPELRNAHGLSMAWFVMVIDPTGKVASCTSPTEIGMTGIGAWSCRTLSARARFNPAHDGAGNPVAQSLSGVLRFVIP